MSNTKVDITVRDHGSLMMVECVTEAAMDWVKANLSLEGWQWMGRSFSCEPLYIDALVKGMGGDGLIIR